MARLMLKAHNLLALDEPTNHMDIRSKDILKQALQAYDGTIIVVSHDRDFLNGLVDKVYEFIDGKVKEHLGGVDDFLRHKKAESFRDIEAKSAPAGAPARAGLVERQVLFDPSALAGSKKVLPRVDSPRPAADAAAGGHRLRAAREFRRRGR